MSPFDRLPKFLHQRHLYASDATPHLIKNEHFLQIKTFWNK
jgi:hypothetical protein